MSILKSMGLKGQMLFIFIFAFALYAHDMKELNGPWILDDKGTVSMNPAVQGELPWKEIWLRDFWGHDQLLDTDSHKSWRPICSATYRLNYVFTGPDTFWFHVTDRLIHAVVSALVLPATILMFTTHAMIEGFEPQTAAFVCSLLFASHPIHVEAVANTTGRAEVLCAFFYLLGFLAYACWGVRARISGVVSKVDTQVNARSISSNVVSVLVMLFFSWCSMLCKEHGITLPVSVCLWDAFLGTSTSITEVFALITFQQPDSTPKTIIRKNSCVLFLVRVAFSAVGTVILVGWRLHKNGDYIPDFSCEQNPGACLPEYHERLLHFSWLWVLNFKLLVWPTTLSPDWSGPSVDPMISLTDPRALALPFLYSSICLFLYSTVSEAWSEGARTSPRRACLRLLLVAWWFMMITFVMSSNLFVYVGFVVADRTLYLPSYGFLCGLTILLFVVPHSLTSSKKENKKTGAPSEKGGSEKTNTHENKGKTPDLKDREEHKESKKEEKDLVQKVSNSSKLSLSIGVVILSGYTAKQLTQTARWADPVELWAEAYRINPNSCINAGELGMSLTNAQRPLDAVPVLWDIHRRELESGWFTTSIRQTATQSSKWQRMGQLLNTRFKLVTALGNSGHCGKASGLIDEALELIGAKLPELAEETRQVAAVAKPDDRFLQLELKNFRESDAQLRRNMAYLLVVKSRCATDLQSMAQLAAAAVQASPQLPFAHDHAHSVAGIIREAGNSGLEPHQVLVGLEKDPKGGQVAIRTFKQKF